MIAATRDPCAGEFHVLAARQLVAKHEPMCFANFRAITFANECKSRSLRFNLAFFGVIVKPG